MNLRLTSRHAATLVMATLAAAASFAATARAEFHIYGADHETGEVVKFAEDGTKLWSFPNRNSHDVQVLENGNVLINPGSVQEVTPDGKIVWELGKPVVRNAESCQRLANGDTMVADNASHAILDVTPDKQVVWRYDVPGKPAMRQVRRLANGNTLICAASNHVVLEVNPAKQIVWRYELAFPYLACRLENGNTLISSGAGAGRKGYFLIEVDPEGKTVWKYGGDDAPVEQQLDWPSGFVRLPDGTIYVSECRSARIRVISPDRTSFRFITSPAMKHAATIAVVERPSETTDGSDTRGQIGPVPHESSRNPPAHPNVIVVMTDDQGLGDFSFMGNPVLQTPHLDAFAREAVRFADFHAGPMCTPARGQLITGLAAMRNGATCVTAGRTFLRPGLPTLPEVFGRAGYATGLFGKWHLGDSYPHRPHDKGFQDSLCHLGWGQLYSAPEAGWPLVDGRAFRNGVEERYRGHCTDFWFDEAMAWMKRQKEAGKPFLCYIPTNAAHGPHIDLEQYVAPYRRAGLPAGPAGFFGMIAHVDARFGDLDRFLAAQGLRDDTIVIFTTDNGGTAGVKTFNAGLRGGKTTYYEGGHRVPCWIRWPRGGFGPPRDIDVPTQNTDLFPTLCDLCGVPPPQRPRADLPYAGTSLATVLRGEASALPERTFVVQYGQQPRKHEACVISGPWRLVQGAELYDVAADRAQARDVAAEHPEIVARLRGDYESWWQGVAGLVNQFVPQSLGATVQPVVELTSGDWQGIFADNVERVAAAVGGPTGGRWNVVVERPGTYEFTLRRWPPNPGTALGATVDRQGGEAAKHTQPAARSFPTIAKAHVRIAGLEAETAANPQAKEAAVRMTLPAGLTTLEAWFADAADEPLCGAFFVTVRGGEK